MAHKKTTEKATASACGLSIEQWRQARQQSSAARTRGRRPSGTASAEAKLATWGPIDSQMDLLSDDTTGGAA